MWNFSLHAHRYLEKSDGCCVILQTQFYVLSPKRALAPFMTSVRRNGSAAEATFETRPYKLHKLDEPPSSTTVCTREDALTMYRQMQMIRRLESAASNLYKEKVCSDSFQLHFRYVKIEGPLLLIWPTEIVKFAEHIWITNKSCSLSSLTRYMITA